MYYILLKLLTENKKACKETDPKIYWMINKYLVENKYVP